MCFSSNCPGKRERKDSEQGSKDSGWMALPRRPVASFFALSSLCLEGGGNSHKYSRQRLEEDKGGGASFGTRQKGILKHCPPKKRVRTSEASPVLSEIFLWTTLLYKATKNYAALLDGPYSARCFCLLLSSLNRTAPTSLSTVERRRSPEEAALVQVPNLE